jgi:nitrate reductase beta subunit
MVLNLDKCIGCHTCSVTCKNVWTNREGVEYAWFNNVETKPGIGYPKDWENQKRWNGGWRRKPTARSSRASAPSGGSSRTSSPTPTCRRSTTTTSRSPSTTSTCRRRPSWRPSRRPRPRSLITGERMEKIEWGPNWEEILGGEFAKRSQDANFEGVQKEIYGQFENTFMMYLPRLCEHCLNPACVAACPSGAIYKREEDGIVLIDQDKCRGWRMCVSACPYKKIYYNWSSGKSEKCIFCFPRIEVGPADGLLGNLRRPHPLSRRLLYDADRIEAAASDAERKGSLPGPARRIFLDPNDPAVIAQARSTACRSLARGGAPNRRSGRWRSSGRSLSRCTRNTARCRWSGTCRRCRRSSRRRPPGEMGSTARCRTCVRCASRSSTSPTC